MNLGLAAMDDRIFLKVSLAVGLLVGLFVWFYSPLTTSEVSLIPDLIFSEDDYHNEAGRIYKDLAILAERRNDFEQALKLYQTSLSHNPTSQELQNRLILVSKMLNQKQTQLAQNSAFANDK